MIMMQLGEQVNKFNNERAVYFQRRVLTEQFRSRPVAKQFAASFLLAAVRTSL